MFYNLNNEVAVNTLNSQQTEERVGGLRLV